jgi:hypothetical protein
MEQVSVSERVACQCQVDFQSQNPKAVGYERVYA